MTGEESRPSNYLHPRLMHITTVPMSLTFLRGQVGFMKRSGWEVLALSSPGPDLERFGEEEDVRVEAVEMRRQFTPLRDAVAVRRMMTIMRDETPTIVHAHTPKGGLLGMLAATLARVPVRVYHMRGLPHVSAAGWRRAVLVISERVSCRLAHAVICVSESIREAAVTDDLCTPAKVHVVGNGSGNGVDAAFRFNPEACRRSGSVKREELGIPPEAPVIGFVGRLVRDKGVVELARAWQKVREQNTNARLVLVGPFEPHDPLPEEIRASFRDDPRVHLMGMDWNTPPLYSMMDLVVLPSYREGFPNVALEAAAMERPIVATRVGGCVDAVQDGVTGVLVPPARVAELAAAIETYLHEPELRRRHGRAARRRVLRDFRPERIWEGIQDIYARLLDEGTSFVHEGPVRPGISRERRNPGENAFPGVPSQQLSIKALDQS